MLSKKLHTSICLLMLLSSSTLAEDDKPAAFFEPTIKIIEGWTVHVDPTLLEGKHADFGNKAMRALGNHLQRVTYILPEARVKELQELPIWLERQHAELSSMQYHPSRGWLEGRHYDPRLAKKVHIPRANALLDRQMWAKHPYVILHELAHAYHDQVLSFDDKRIIDAFERAKVAGNYESVLSHQGKMVSHYALSNHKEYFAESTEAYLGVNDFFPFVRAELKQHDPTIFALLKEIWGPVP